MPEDEVRRQEERAADKAEQVEGRAADRAEQIEGRADDRAEQIEGRAEDKAERGVERAEDKAERAEERRTDNISVEAQIQAGAAVQAARLAEVAGELVREARASRTLLKQQIKNSGLNPLFVKTVIVALVLVGLGVAAALRLAWRADDRGSQALQVSQEQLAVSEQNKVVIETVNEVLAEVQSCTTPKGECSKRGQRDTATAVGSINTVTQVAVICADQLDGRTAIEACIHDRLRAIGLVK